jgi:hypothetical protein
MVMNDVDEPPFRDETEKQKAWRESARERHAGAGCVCAWSFHAD